MREKSDDKFTVQVAGAVQKTLRSRDSAERLVRAVIGLWRDSTGGRGKPASALVLDFQGIEQLSQCAAVAIVEFRREFSEDKNPEIRFSNTSGSVSGILEAAERSLRQSGRKNGNRKKKGNRFTIEI